MRFQLPKNNADRSLSLSLPSLPFWDIVTGNNVDVSKRKKKEEEAVAKLTRGLMLEKKKKREREKSHEWWLAGIPIFLTLRKKSRPADRLIVRGGGRER